jgi:hypothetical protein
MTAKWDKTSFPAGRIRVHEDDGPESLTGARRLQMQTAKPLCCRVSRGHPLPGLVPKAFESDRLPDTKDGYA